MFNRKKSATPTSPEQQQPENYDDRCIEVDGVDDMSIEELTKEIVNLYGQMPQAPSSDAGADSPLA